MFTLSSKNLPAGAGCERKSTEGQDPMSQTYCKRASVLLIAAMLLCKGTAVIATGMTSAPALKATGTNQPHEDNQARQANTSTVDQSDINNENQNNANQQSDLNGATNPGGSDTTGKTISGADSSAVPDAHKKASLPTKIFSTYPKRFIRACPGFVLGTPIAVVRKIISESKQATFDLAGDNRNPFILGGLSILGIPAGVLSGSTEAPVKAAVNGWKYGEDQLFSKEYFSLGKSDTLPQQ